MTAPTTTLPPVPRGPTPRAGRGGLLAALAAATVFIVAHGCHGDDEDHEPAVAPPVSLPAGDPR